MKDWYRVSGPELRELLHDSLKLAALESGGVDNWDWYGESLCDFLKANSLNPDHEGFYEFAERELDSCYEPIEYI